MDNNETMLDEELDTEVDEDTADDVDDADTDGDSEDEFEYDEDGNIIIPDVVFDEDKEEDDDTASEEGETDDGEENEDSESDEGVAKPDNASQESEELAKLRRRVQALESQGKETLSKLGVKTDDVLEGFASLAAEADGISTEEYLKKRADAERDAQARQLFQQQEFEKIARADLAELQATYPETKQYKDIRELPQDILKEFGRYRDMGLSAKKAYAAANPDGIRTTVATAVKKQSLHDSKSHLHSTVPKGSKDNSISMPSAKKAEWRDLFPNLSDKEIEALYKKTAQ